MSTNSPDWNLLVGVLALRMGLVERDQLVTALNAWFADQSKPLSSVLAERGFISERARPLLEDLAREHLAKRGGDAQNSLREICSRDEQASAISSQFVPEFETLPAQFNRPTSAPTVGGPDERSVAMLAGGRYRVLAEHAEGGLGRVLRAKDEELGRTVALKEIKPRYADDPHSQQRFVLEAEVTGGLEHPGIAPVYSLGRYPDGRPYYAMRFIRGETLGQAIERFHGADAPGRDEGERTLELQKLLRHFIDLCNAIGYAHSRGVVHRDLKPANVMLGSFGETLVVDWGLAKVVGRAVVASGLDEPTLRPSSGSVGSATMAGSVIGTPAYMSPEQAAGSVDDLGPASDVYSLGATLYCLLTGKPAFSGRDKLLDRVKSGEFPPPRQVQPRTPKPLESICLKAMATQPENRYESPAELVADLEHWMADEPVSAHRESARERLRRWMRRHRTWVQAGGLALITIALVSCGATWLVTRAWHGEREAKRTAVLWFGQAREAVDKWLTGAGDALAYYPATAKTRERLLQIAERDYEEFTNLRSDDVDLEVERGRTCLRLGHVRWQLGDAAGAENAYARAEKLFQDLARTHPRHLICRVELANSRANLGVTFRQTKRLEQAEAAMEGAVRELESLVEDHVDESFVRESLAQALINYGELLADIGRLTEAESSLRRSLKMLSDIPTTARLAGGSPLSAATARQLLGRVLGELGRYNEAIAQHEMAVEACDELVERRLDDPASLEKRASANVYLAAVLRPLGRPDQEAGAYARAIDDYQDLAQALPNSPRLAEHLAVTWIDLAGLSHKLGRVEEAEQQLKVAGELLDGLARKAEGDASPDIQSTHTLLDYSAYLRRVQGELQRDRGLLGESRTSLTHAIMLYDQLLQPTVDDDGAPATRYVEGRARCMSHLGQTLHLSGEHEQADQLFATAVDELTRLAPLTPGRRDSLAFVCQHRAVLLRDLKKDEEANRLLEQARGLWEGLATAEAAAPEHVHRWAHFLANCPFEEQRQAAEAVQLAGRLTDEVASNGAYWNTLGIARYRNRDEQGAVEALNKAIETRSATHGLDWLFLAMAQMKLGDQTEAEQSFDRGSNWVDEWLPHHAESRRARDEAAELLGRNKRES